MSKVDTLSDVLSRHKMVFAKGLQTIKSFKADIQLQDDVKPIFCKARPVPHALCQKVEEELDCVEKLGVIKKGFSYCLRAQDSWKYSLRIFIDFNVSVNQVLLDNPYPLPDTEDSPH